jgi:4-carboxymuconolactone decarboxylase
MRLQPPSLDAMTPEQRLLREELLTAGGPRALIGPVGIWLNNPELARQAAQLGLFIARRTTLAKDLREIAILITARVWAAEYEWYEHVKLAAAAGVPADMIDDIKQGKTPRFVTDQQRVVYNVASSIHTAHRLSDSLYTEAVELIGEPHVLELVAVIGMYVFVAITLNTFEVRHPDAGDPP